MFGVLEKPGFKSRGFPKGLSLRFVSLPEMQIG